MGPALQEECGSRENPANTHKEPLNSFPTLFATVRHVPSARTALHVDVPGDDPSLPAGLGGVSCKCASSSSRRTHHLQGLTLARGSLAHEKYLDAASARVTALDAEINALRMAKFQEPAPVSAPESAAPGAKKSWWRW